MAVARKVFVIFFTVEAQNLFNIKKMDAFPICSYQNQLYWANMLTLTRNLRQQGLTKISRQILCSFHVQIRGMKIDIFIHIYNN